MATIYSRIRRVAEETYRIAAIVLTPVLAPLWAYASRRAAPHVARAQAWALWALRWILIMFAVAALLLTMWVLATLAYALLYAAIMPTHAHRLPVHFDFSHPSTAGLIRLADEQLAARGPPTVAAGVTAATAATTTTTATATATTTSTTTTAATMPPLHDFPHTPTAHVDMLGRQWWRGWSVGGDAGVERRQAEEAVARADALVAVAMSRLEAARRVHAAALATAGESAANATADANTSSTAPALLAAEAQLEEAEMAASEARSALADATSAARAALYREHESLRAARGKLRKRERLLAAGQEYDVHLQMRVGDSPEDLASAAPGVFMSRLEVWCRESAAGAPVLLARSSRPFTLRYRSPLLRHAERLVTLVPTLLGFAEESQVVTVALMEGFEETAECAASDLRFQLAPASPRPDSAARLHIFEADVWFFAQLSGVRWFMFHYNFTAAAIFITCIFGAECVGVLSFVLALWWCCVRGRLDRDGRDAGAGSGSDNDDEAASRGDFASVVAGARARDREREGLLREWPGWEGSSPPPPPPPSGGSAATAVPAVVASAAAVDASSSSQRVAGEASAALSPAPPASSRSMSRAALAADPIARDEEAEYVEYLQQKYGDDPTAAAAMRGAGVASYLDQGDRKEDDLDTSVDAPLLAPSPAAARAHRMPTSDSAASLSSTTSSAGDRARGEDEEEEVAAGYTSDCDDQEVAAELRRRRRG